jgi:hypothetical protein
MHTPQRTRVLTACASATRSRVLQAGVVCIAMALVVACSKREEAIPSDATARNTWMQQASTKLDAKDQNTLARFVARMDAQQAAGKSATTSDSIPVSRALELQSAYEQNVAKAQTNLQDQLAQAKKDIAIDVVDQNVVKAGASRPAGAKALRFTVKVKNSGARTVNRLAMRIEIREASGAYQAAIPSLDLTGPLRSGDTGRSTQTFNLDPALHKYILEGKPVYITAYPLEIAYADGAKLAPGTELKALESLHNAKVE